MRLQGVRIVVAIVALLGTAHADSDSIEGELLADASFLEIVPSELTRRIEPEHFEARLAMLERATNETQHPLVRANLVLLRADLLAAQGLQLGMESFVAGRRALGSEYRARARTLYMSLYCDPANTRPDFSCEPDPTLRGWKNLDDALAHFAFLLDHEQRREAVFVHRRLVAQRPESPHVAAARLAIGELERAARNYEAALVEYDAVARSADRRGAFALFRRGEVELQLARPKAAFATFAGVLARDTDSLLAISARRGLVEAFARYGAPGDARPTFERIAPGHDIEMLTEVAAAWWRGKRSADAIAIFRELLRRYPTHGRACMWQASIVMLLHELHDGPRALEETEHLVRALARVRAGAEDLDNCHFRTRDLTLARARRLSRQAIEADQIFLADRLYELFLHAFPDDTEVSAAKRERLVLRNVADRLMRR